MLKLILFKFVANELAYVIPSNDIINKLRHQVNYPIDASLAKELMVNNAYLRAFEPRNYFLLLKGDLQSIFLLTQKLDIQLDHFNHISTQAFHEKNINMLELSLTMGLKILKKTVHRLNNEINLAFKHQNMSSPVFNTLQLLRVEIQTALYKIQSEIDMNIITKVIDAVKKHDDFAISEYWDKIHLVSVKNAIAKFLDDERLLNILQQQKNYQKEFDEAYLLLTGSIKHIDDEKAVKMGNNILACIKQHPNIGVFEAKHLTLLTEVAHRLIFGFYDPTNTKNSERLIEISKRIAEGSSVLSADLLKMMREGIYFSQ